MTLALMLAVCRRVTLLDKTTRTGRFLKAELRMTSFELYQKTVGIIGLGTTRRARCEHDGCDNVLAHHSTSDPI